MDFHKRHGQGRHRYWKITDANLDMAYKHLYCPDDAERHMIPEHAGHYKWFIAKSLKHYAESAGRPGVAVVAFDTELFCHWWFEGPDWLYLVLKWVHQDPEIRSATCSNVLAEQPPSKRTGVAESSWGNHFDYNTWVEPEVEWVWEHIYHVETELGHLARAYNNSTSDEMMKRILRQATRQAFLLMESDWQFMISNWSTRNLSEKRVQEHHAQFERLAQMAWAYGQFRPIPEAERHFLEDSEDRDSLVPEVKIESFRSAP